MGVVAARCCRCERKVMVVVYQKRGQRLRNQLSRCCAARLKRAWRSESPAGTQGRPR